VVFYKVIITVIIFSYIFILLLHTLLLLLYFFKIFCHLQMATEPNLDALMAEAGLLLDNRVGTSTSSTNLTRRRYNLQKEQPNEPVGSAGLL